MEYLVIELNEEPHILCTHDIMSDGLNLKPNVSRFNSGGNPMIFKDKNTAFRIADECKQGLVYPITNIMKILERIKLISKDGWSRGHILDELLILTDEIL